MNKKHLDGFRKSKIWNKDFKDIEDTLDRGVQEDKDIPNFAKAMQLIIRTSDVMKDLGERHLAKYDLSIAQKGVLAALYYCPDGYMTQTNLSKFVYTSKANMSSLLDRMEGKDFIKRDENPENKREKKVLISKKGKGVFDKLIKESEKLPFDEILTDSESKTLIKLLTKVRDKHKELLE
jgi:DNA-binding MarR family transcriptional regulator